MKRKDFKEEIFGQELVIENFPSILHNDLRHIIKGSLRKKPKYGLSKDRMSILEEAIQQHELSFQHEKVPFNSIRAFKDYLISKRTDYRNNFKANEYYNTSKAASYSGSNVVSQKTLTERVFQLLDIPTSTETNILLDVCCGSGLSVLGKFTIGIDASLDMLNIARNTKPMADFVLWDLKQKLPFRQNSFDYVTSVSALHFLCGPTDQLERCARFFSSLNLVCETAFAAQFFPESKSVPRLLLKAAQEHLGPKSKLLLDFSHHTKSFRWFISSSKVSCQDKVRMTCLLYSSLQKLSWFDKIEVGCCILDRNEERHWKHNEWVIAQHCSLTRGILRRLNFDSSLLSIKEKELAKKLLKVFTSRVSLQELKSRYSELDAILHTSHEV